MNDEILRKLLEMAGNNITHEEYHKLWNDLGPLEIKMTKQYGE
jgi:hypothetical protein